MTRIVSMAALGLGLAALSSSPALALDPETIVVHVPFAFSVADETLPAGDYRINPLNDLDRQVLEIRSADGHHAVLTFVEDGPSTSRNAEPELVFDRYGTKEFLRVVRMPQEPEAIVEPSRSESEAARVLTTDGAAHGSAGNVNP
jgi:hypothetical protein